MENYDETNFDEEDEIVDTDALLEAIEKCKEEIEKCKEEIEKEEDSNEQENWKLYKISR